MKLKNLLYLFLIPALALSFTSCDDDDDDITGTWKYEGVEKYSVKTNDDSLTVAIQRYMEDYDIAGDSDHKLVFDDKTLNIYYGEEIDQTYDYKFKDGQLTTYYKNMSATSNFNVSGNTALLTDDYLSYFYEDGIDEYEIEMMMHLYPETLEHLEDADWTKLKVTEVIAYQKYVKQ